MSSPPRFPRRLAPLAAAFAAAMCGAALAAPAAAAPAPPFPEFYGISPATELDEGEVSRIGGSGAGTLRAPFYWPHIEPDPPGTGGDPGPLPPLDPPAAESKSWVATDALVGDAARHGLRVLPFVYGTPDWVASDPARPPLDTPEGRAAWQDLLRELVVRYGPAGEFWSENPEVPKVPITAWQIANEPNSELFWKPAPSPAEYADLLGLSSAAIRGADAEAAIVLAGMFGTPARGIPAWEFLEALYGVPGTADSFDAYALHPYAPNLRGLKAQIELSRDVVRDNGDRRLPLLVTEIGWPTDGPSGYRLVKSPAAQKRLLKGSFKIFLEKRKRWKLRRVIWYTWRDNDVQPDCSVCRYSGLFTSGGEPKPAWRKFAQFAGGRP